MFESPLLQEIISKTRRETLQRSLLRVLEVRFGTVPTSLTTAIRRVQDERQLELLQVDAVRVAHLDSFEAHLPK